MTDYTPMSHKIKTIDIDIHIDPAKYWSSYYSSSSSSYYILVFFVLVLKSDN